MNNEDVTVLAAQSGKERNRKNMSTLSLHLLKLGSHSGEKTNKTRRAEKQEIHMFFFFLFGLCLSNNQNLPLILGVIILV